MIFIKFFLPFFSVLLSGCFFPLTANEKICRFDSVFEHVRDIPIEETNEILLSSITGFDFDKNENFWFVDHKSNQVLMSDKNGKALRVMCRKGSGPSDVYLPFGIFIASNDLVYISSFVKRITVIDLKGEHIKSFLAAKGPFPTTYIIADGKSGNIFISGPRYESSPENKPLLANQVHAFDKDGNFLFSTLPLSDQASKFRLKEFILSYADLDEAGNLYCIQRTEYKINVYNPKGELIRRFGNTPLYYKPITEPYKGNSKDSYDIYFESITTVDRVFYEGGHVYVMANNFSRKNGDNFFIDIYEPGGKRLNSSIRIPGNMRLQRVKNNKFFFLEKREKEDGSSEENVIRVYTPTIGGYN